MLTQCPQCKTVFRLRAEQLSAAGGKVRCGQCHSVFDASHHLVEQPSPKPVPAEAPVPPRAPADKAPSPTFAPVVPEPVVPEPVRSIATDRGDPAAEMDDLSIQLDQLFSDIDQSTVRSAAEPAASPGALAGGGGEAFGAVQIETLLTSEAGPEESELPWHHEEATTTFDSVAPIADAGAAPDPSELAIDDGDDDIAEFDLPEPELTTAQPIFKERAAAPTLPPTFGDIAVQSRVSGWATLGWSLGILLLMAALIGQYAYLNSADLVSYAQLRPALVQLCRYSGCAIPPRRDVKDITLLERDIRSSDKYQGVLIITATLVNRAPFAQPYPDVKVAMHDVDGNVVASRLFHPNEYLAGGDRHSSFAAQATAQLELRVADPGPAAVGFEFTFY